jgi:GTP-binding protein Era
MKRSGFITIAGRPNVGKSTILNGLLGEKLAIITKKPETTRDTIKGILTEGDCQLVFIDTPGIHKPHDLLGRIMITQARSSILEADIILFISEKRGLFDKDDLLIRDNFPPADKKEDKKVFLIINKVDRVKDKKILLPLMRKARDFYPFDEIIPICALKEKDIAGLLSIIKKNLNKGPFFYPEDQLTDRPEEFIIKETVREKALELTYEEVPHSIAVMVDEISENKNGLKIFATIFVERPSQKSIIIGKSGAKIKQIGETARKELEDYFGKHIFLDLWVKVFDKWKKDPGALKEFGYTE